MPRSGQRSELLELRNIGPTIERRLKEIGVMTRRDLERLGPVEAYQRMAALYPGATIPVCYYLYSLEGALTDTHWDAIPEATKARLRRAVGRR